jgi:hypothetical protein
VLGENKVALWGERSGDEFDHAWNMTSRSAPDGVPVHAGSFLKASAGLMTIAFLQGDLCDFPPQFRSAILRCGAPKEIEIL